MNPFDLRGPEFLLFYLCFSIGVIAVIIFLRHRAESGEPPRIDLSDPYLIAYLRGGENEALRVAVISLIDRKLLQMNEQTIQTRMHVNRNQITHPIEYEVLRKFNEPGKADSIFKDRDLKEAFGSYQQTLEQAGLMPDANVRRDRLMRLSLALVALTFVGAIKVMIGLSLGRPVAFLIMMMVAAMFITAVCSFPRLTAQGKAMVADITNLYSDLKTRVSSIGVGATPADLAMCAAVFGIGTLSTTHYAYARTLFPQASSSGSSCGSSSDGGSSDGGGGGGCGGGGCGGCGS